MTRDDDFIGQLEGYLDEYQGVTPLPAAVRAAVRAQLPTTMQRGGLRKSMRFLTTNRPLQIALATVAALAVGLAALSALNPRIGNEPTPTAHPSAFGIFEPVAGWIIYGDEDGIWGVDPAAPADPATRIENVEAGSPLGWSSDGTRLLIERSGPQGGSDLFVLHADGSETRLTERPRDLRHAAISPDGSRVVFADCTDTLDRDSCPLYAVDADGGSAEMLSEAGVVEGLTFSPDGARIAYVIGRGDSDHRVWVVGSDGSDPHELLANDTTLGGGHVRGQHPLAWSPAGDRIALGLAGAIYTFATDGSGFTRVTGGDQPYWSPDGSRFAYSIGSVLAIADADGSNRLLFDFGISGPWHPGRLEAFEESPPPPTGPRRDGEFIVFEPLGSGLGWDLAAQDPGTGKVRKIVATDGIVDCPDRQRCQNFVKVAEWSSDGHWVAFEVSNGSLDGPPLGPCDPMIGLWVATIDGEPRQLTKPCDAPPPTSEEAVAEVWEWSPAGARLAYARIDGETDELFVIDPADGSRTSLGPVDNTPRQGLLPTLPGWAMEWSPDGTRIAYADGGSVYAVDVDGASRSLLADSLVDILDIAWSPDGKRILIHDQGRDRIQVMNADGSDLHVVLDGQDACCATAWSPTGDRILYQLSTEVWTVLPDGSNAIKVFDSGGCQIGGADPLPAWAPDGTQVAYNACGVWEVANADGTGEAQPINELLWRSWYSGGLTEGDLRGIGHYDH